MAEPASLQRPPAQATEPPPLAGPAISSHRLLGSGRSTALLRPDAEVDWWCAPDVDSPPPLWSLLDAAGGGCQSGQQCFL